MTKIYSVESVKLHFEKTNPPNLVIEAEGCASSGGWHSFALSKVEFITPPADGFEVFTFVGKKPCGPVPEVIDRGKKAKARIDNIDIPNYWGKGRPLQGVRVEAETNKCETRLSADQKKAA